VTDPAPSLLRWLVATALRQRAAVVILAALLVGLGARAVREAPLDVFPEFAPPLVEIQTEVPGLSTGEVESLVSVPLENALGGVSGVAHLRSKSVLGLSSVVLVFEEGTDLLRVRQLVQEKVDLVARDLPDVARPPVLLQPLSSLSRVMKIGITSPTRGQMELTELALWTIRPRLLAVPGVANVAIWGQRARQLQLRVDPMRLAAMDVTLDEVERAAADATALHAGGFVDTHNQRLPVTLEPGTLTIDDLARTPLPARAGRAPAGRALALGDVAEAVEGHGAPIGDAVIDDVAGLLLVVEKQPAANTLDVTRGVEHALAALAPALGDARVDPTIFRPATFIEQSLENLGRSLLIGASLLVLVLFAFLGDWRSALISAVSIPVSLVLGAWVLCARGGTLDTMALAGLAIALGEVVDDAILDVENIFRRLRGNAQAGAPRRAFDVVLAASLEMRSAVVWGSVIVVLVVLPVFFLEGLAGAFFRPLASAYVLAMGASLGTALLLTPALSLLLLPRRAAAAREPWLVRGLRGAYSRVLEPILRRPRTAAAILLAAVALLLAALPASGRDFLPRFRERDFLMHWVEKPGTSLDAMRRITERASRELRTIPGVRNFGAHLGRAEVADEVVGPNFTELWISVEEEVDYDATVARITEVVEGHPGLQRDLLTYLRERIKEVLTGASASLVVRVYGPDLAGLRAAAERVRDSIEPIGGVAELKVEAQERVPQLVVRVHPDRCGEFDVAPGDVRRAVATLVHGSKVGQVHGGQKVNDVVVWGVPGVRADEAALRELPIGTPGGGVVRLRDVATVALESAPNAILRDGASRRIDVTLNVRDRDLGAVALEVEAALRTVDLPAGMHAELLGEWAERSAAAARLRTFSLLSLVAILVVLHANLRSWRLVLLVALTVPLALVGGLAGACVGGGVLSLGSLVGFVTVLGVSVRTTLVMASHYRHLQVEEGMPFGRELVLRGAGERIAPVLMTSLTTALALIPIAIAPHRPGHEIEAPMAAVILGGLLFSTLLVLLLVPALYLALGRGTVGGSAD